jgi:hypothetical protein
MILDVHGALPHQSSHIKPAAWVNYSSHAINFTEIIAMLLFTAASEVPSRGAGRAGSRRHLAGSSKHKKMR